MSVRKWASPVVTLAALGGIGVAAFRTQDRWVPVVFPAKAAKPAGDGDKGKDDHTAKPVDRVKLSPQAQKNLALDVDTPTPREYWRTMLIPGVVVDRPGESDRSVTSKVAGVVTAITARPGDTVKAGDPLFTIQLASEFLQSVQGDLAKAARELEIVSAKRDRVAVLVKAGTRPGQELIDEENQVKRFTTQVQQYRRQLQVFGLTPDQASRAEKGEVITEVAVVAPNGTPADAPLFEVQELKVALGEQVTAGQALCLLANHQRLYVEGRAFKSEADTLAAAAQGKTPIRAEFADETPGTWKPQEPLHIHHLANQVDPATRTFAFYLPLDNQPKSFERDGKTHFVWRYRPGQRARLMVPVEKLVVLAADGKTEVLPFVLPAGAVVREGPEAFVFIQTGDIFVRKPVRVLHADRAEIVIANDGSVTEAEYVVRNQAAAINRALKAQAATGGEPHGHSHD